MKLDTHNFSGIGYEAITARTVITYIKHSLKAFKTGTYTSECTASGIQVSYTWMAFGHVLPQTSSFIFDHVYCCLIHRGSVIACLLSDTI